MTRPPLSPEKEPAQALYDLFKIFHPSLSSDRERSLSRCSSRCTSLSQNSCPCCRNRSYSRTTRSPSCTRDVQVLIFTEEAGRGAIQNREVTERASIEEACSYDLGDSANAVFNRLSRCAGHAVSEKSRVIRCHPALPDNLSAITQEPLVPRSTIPHKLRYSEFSRFCGRVRSPAAPSKLRAASPPRFSFEDQRQATRRGTQPQPAVSQQDRTRRTHSANAAAPARGRDRTHGAGSRAAPAPRSRTNTVRRDVRRSTPSPEGCEDLYGVMGLNVDLCGVGDGTPPADVLRQAWKKCVLATHPDTAPRNPPTSRLPRRDQAADEVSREVSHTTSEKDDSSPIVRRRVGFEGDRGTATRLAASKSADAEEHCPKQASTEDDCATSSRLVHRSHSFSSVQRAFAVLRDPQKRAKYHARRAQFLQAQTQFVSNDECMQQQDVHCCPLDPRPSGIFSLLRPLSTTIYPITRECRSGNGMRRHHHSGDPCGTTVYHGAPLKQPCSGSHPQSSGLAHRGPALKPVTVTRARVPLSEWRGATNTNTTAPAPSISAQLQPRGGKYGDMGKRDGPRKVRVDQENAPVLAAKRRDHEPAKAQLGGCYVKAQTSHGPVWF